MYLLLPQISAIFLSLSSFHLLNTQSTTFTRPCPQLPPPPPPSSFHFIDTCFWTEFFFSLLKVILTSVLDIFVHQIFLLSSWLPWHSATCLQSSSISFPSLAGLTVCRCVSSSTESISWFSLSIDELGCVFVCLPPFRLCLLLLYFGSQLFRIQFIRLFFLQGLFFCSSASLDCWNLEFVVSPS